MRPSSRLQLAAVAAVTLVATACATTRPYQWDDPASIDRAGADAFPHANAVELLRIRSVAIVNHGVSVAERDTRHHRVLILSEAGLALAEQRIEVGLLGLENLSHLHARVISPRGESRELGEADIVKEAAGPLDRSSAGELRYTTEKSYLLRFPGVEVGSILEWEFSVDSAYFTLAGRYDLVGNLPVLHSEVELLVTPELEPRIRIRNAPGLQLQDLGVAGNCHRWGVATGRIGGDREEALRPPYLARVPAIELQVMGYADHLTLWYETMRDWSHVAEAIVSSRPAHQILYSARDLPEVNAGRCDGDRSCVVSAVVEALHGAVRFDGMAKRVGGTGEARPILERGRGNNIELADMLFRLLDRAGIESRWAVTNSWTGIPDPTAPTTLLDYLLLQLPPERPGEPPVWLDPACEYCRPGEVAPVVRGRAALLLRQLRTFPRAAFEATETVVSGESHVPDGTSVFHRATLDPASGDLEVHSVEEWSGAEADERIFRTRGWSDDQLREDAERFVRHRQGSLASLSRGVERCNRLVGRCTRELTFRLPGYAAVGGDRLRVPTSLLHHLLDGELIDEERRHDIAHWYTQVDREEIVLGIPAGYRVDALPAGAYAAHPALEATLAFRQRDDAVVVTRTVKRPEGRWERTQYPGIRAAGRALAGMRHRLVTLTRSGGGR